MQRQTLKHRHSNMPVPLPDLGAGTIGRGEDEGHPAGDIRHSILVQVVRLMLFATYFWACAITVNVSQYLGIPLYWINRDYYYAYMSLTKQSFGLLITTMTQWWSPTVVRISGDESVKGQIRQVADGRVECDFADRLVLMANHQLYFDWLYLWWIAYTNRMHGHIFIILKESLKYIPVLGQGMIFYGFIFMSRKMDTDKPRLAHRLQQLKTRHRGPMSGKEELDPMWLLIFPEGTNASENGRAKSMAWAAKQGIPDMQHQLLPRSTGSFFILNELKDTVDWVYDCTLAYEGIPRGKFGQDYFTLQSAYFQGRPPKSVNMYWRRFAMADIPLSSPSDFDLWLRERWTEKDQLMEDYVVNGRFPSSWSLDTDGIVASNLITKKGDGCIETEVKPKHWWEVLQIFVVLATFGLIANLAVKMWNLVLHGSMRA